jgi:hypothetical protein
VIARHGDETLGSSTSLLLGKNPPSQFPVARTAPDTPVAQHWIAHSHTVVYDERLQNWKKIMAPTRTYSDLVALAQASIGLPNARDTTNTFFDNAAALFQTYKDSIQSNETKSGALLGYVGGGTGVLALLSGTTIAATPALRLPVT